MPQPFQWNEKAGRFLGPGGKFVAGQKLRGALDGYLDEKSGWAREWAGQLKRREISLADWQRGMERELTKAHLNAAAMGRGGAAQMDKAALEAAGAFLREELGHLAALAGKIEAGLPLDGRFLNRVGQYAQAPRAHFHEVEREEQRSRGANQERSVRHARDSCEDCVYWDGVSWQPLGTVPTPGGLERRCRRKCRCTKEYRTIEDE